MVIFGFLPISLYQGKEAGESEMNRKIKKIVYRIGIVPVILALSIGLLAGGVALAEDDDVEPQATATGTVNPNDVTNDGASVLHFSWDIYDWLGTAAYYTFQVNVRGDPDNPLYIQASDDKIVTPPGQDFPSGDISMDLQDVDGIVGAPDVHIRQPDYTEPNITHDWIVRETIAPGLYAAWVNLYLYDPDTPGQPAAEPAAGAYIPFTIMQAQGYLRVIKLDYITKAPLNNWEFKVYEAGTPNLVGTGLTGTAGNPTGEYTFTLDVGDYDVAETIWTDWVCMVPGPSGEMEDVTVSFNATVTVTFENQANVGNLTIIKYEDFNGNGSHDGGEALLDGWSFSISGPASGSGTTSGGGYLTFTGIPVGDYTVTETSVPAGWRCTDPGGTPPYEKTGITVSTGATTEVYFGNQQLGNLLIFKYEDINGNGTYDGADTPAANWGFTVDGMGPYFTDGTGYVTVPDLVPGSYTVREVSGPPPDPGFSWKCTDPGSGKQKTATVPSGGMDEVWFGNQQIPHEVPTLGQWGIIAMSTVFVAMLVWFGVRRRRLAQMN